MKIGLRGGHSINAQGAVGLINENDIRIYNRYSWRQLAHRLCNAIDSNIPIEQQEQGNGYVITNYLPPDSANYDGVNINKILEYFKGVTCYMRGNGKGIWIGTQYLHMNKCNELKGKLRQLVQFNRKIILRVRK